MAFTKKNEEAVSPVIGVILMVAITVILAAVIAAFVFGMAGNIQKTKVVAVTLSRPNVSGVYISDAGGQDAASLIAFNVSANGNAATIPVAPTGMKAGDATGSLVLNTGYTSVPVGTTFYAQVGTGSHIIVVGTFADATSQILLDTTN